MSTSTQPSAARGTMRRQQSSGFPHIEPATTTTSVIEPSAASGTMPGVHNGGFPHIEPARSHQVSSGSTLTPESSDSSSEDEKAAARAASEKAAPPVSRNETAYYLAPQHHPNVTGNEDIEETIKDAFGHITEQDRAELMRIATARRSYTAGDVEKTDTLAGVEMGDPKLDPSNEAFDIYVWARHFLHSMDEENQVQRETGFVFKHLNVTGSGSALNLQKNVGSLFMAPLRLNEYISFGGEQKKILRDFNGSLRSGEMLIVLGRPGSGCSTFLKALSGEWTGLSKVEGSEITYDGIPQAQMIKHFKGEVVYNQEVEKHFPHLTVGQTLTFAASCRTPSNRVKGKTRKEYIEHFTSVIMAIFGLTHTRNTKVGNDFIRGVSGGERKRVSIAEMALAGAPVACWDNSTRGLDSATALKFVQSLHTASKVGGTTHAVAIYQASQAIYDEFDKAIVLYEGRQIYYGPCKKAKNYFDTMGWQNPPRQTDGDFLTSVTNPSERKPKKGMEDKVPRTPEAFEEYWKASQEYADNMKEIEAHEQEFPVEGDTLANFTESHRARQARHTRKGSPFLISIPMQIKYCTIRAYQRLLGDYASSLTVTVGMIGLSLIIGSVFYETPATSGELFAKEAVLFFSILINALISVPEINALFDQRPIVAKQTTYAFYHPWTEAAAGIVSDVPVKFVVACCFNVTIYFLSNLRREPSQFFIFFLFNFMATLMMSQFFRTIAAASKTLSQALSLAGILILFIVIYTGFTLPRQDEHHYFRWLSWCDPIAYAFEALLVNEMHGRNFTCSTVVPTNYVGDNFVCESMGAVAGELYVNGDAYLEVAFQYKYDHIWRNLGFMFGFMTLFLTCYMGVTELNSATSSKAEVLLFRRGHVPAYMLKGGSKDEEGGEGENKDAIQAAAQHGDDAGGEEGKESAIPPQTDLFTWQDVVYDIEIKGEPRRLLDHVNGYVKPGTLTALMGVSGAGKTTLLDVLAQRVSMGVITGDMLVNGTPLDPSFQRSTGYVQQQDLHLETSTVREALRFSAVCRQPPTVSVKEKYEYVEEVIKMLNMEDFSEAVVGVPGEGLNVEQRKLLTIGVELAAKPALLLFLDEPTSGLDSQSSWAIVAFLRKLADSGQAILCTIHQPSAILFQEFDRLLFLARGGKTVYFGPIGNNSETLLKYFEDNGSRHCGEDENPAEFMLEIGNDPKVAWYETWKASKEAQTVIEEIKELQGLKAKNGGGGASNEDPKGSHKEFAMPFIAQYKAVQIRVFQQYWRTPGYLFAKFALGIISGLFIGFSFYREKFTEQGMQNIILSIFMITTIFTTLIQQIMPLFVTQRALYEVRERPSKAYSWKAFLLAQIVVEIPYQIVLAICVFGCYNYPVFEIQSSQRQGLVLLFFIQFFLWTGTFAQMLIAGLPDQSTAANLGTIMFAMCLVFNGVMQPPYALPGFWLFMYRVSPLTYFVDGLTATVLYNHEVRCGKTEINHLDPPSGQTCQQYLGTFATDNNGAVYNPDSTSDCEFCSYTNANQFLDKYEIKWDQRWRNYGLLWAYIAFNIGMVIVLYYIARVHKGSFLPSFPKKKKAKKPEDKEKEKK